MRRSFIVMLALSASVGCEQDYNLSDHPDVDPADITECGFTAVEGTDVRSYDCNPVLTTTGEAWANTLGSTAFAVTEVLGHPFYQMWYIGLPSADATSQYGLGYAVSDSGTSWSSHPAAPLLSPSSANAWDGSRRDSLQVIWDDSASQYVMLFQGYNLNTDQWGLGAATSPDGVFWATHPNNPVLDLGQGVGLVLGWCWPLGLQRGEVVGYTGYMAGYTRPNGPCEMFSLSSSDGNSWIPSDRVVLPVGPEGAWDDEGIISVAVTELDGVHHMFYVGFGAWVVQGSYRNSAQHFLGHATSTDGLTWTKDPEPLPLHRTFIGEVGSVSATTVGNRIHLWLTDIYDGESAVGYFLYEPGAEP